MVDFDEAIDRLVADPERKSRVINPQEKEIIAYHEAGHALVAESRPHADRVAKVSIIPRGVVGLGFTRQRPTEDRYLMTRAELLDRLDVRSTARGKDDRLTAHGRVRQTITRSGRRSHRWRSGSSSTRSSIGRRSPG